jgi:hypothetical protein
MNEAEHAALKFDHRYGATLAGTWSTGSSAPKD